MQPQESATRPYLPDQAPGIRQPEVLNELNRLAEVCKSLDKLTFDLEERLKSVLSLRTEHNTSGPATQPAPVRVALAELLHEQVVTIDMVCMRLGSLQDRLEI
jgi:hypothetical protein